MEYKTYTYGIDGLTELVNQAREVLANELAAAGVIDQEAADSIIDEYSFLLVRKGIFGKSIDKMMGMKKDDLRMKLVSFNIENNKNNKEIPDVYQSEDSNEEGVDIGDS